MPKNWNTSTYTISLAKNASKMFDSRDPDGDGVFGGASGGTPSLAWSAPDGLADGNELMLTTDGSEGWDFGGGASKKATFGFGQGELYNLTLGSGISNHTDPLSSETWLFEFEDDTSRRKVVEKDNIRALVTQSPVNNGGSALGGGFMLWDNGGPLADNEKIYVSRILNGSVGFEAVPSVWHEIKSVDSDTQVTLKKGYSGSTNSDDEIVISSSKVDDTGKVVFRGSVTNGSATVTSNESTSFLSTVSAGQFLGPTDWSQWKELRLSDRAGFGTVDDIYLKKNQNNEGSTGTGAWVNDRGNNGFGQGPNSTGEWHRLDHEISLGTQGTADGTIKGRTVVPILSKVAETTSFDGDGPLHWADQRVRWLMFQEFFDNGNDVKLYRTDQIIQIGSFARFEIADSDDPSTMTESYNLPFKSWSSGKCTLHLWRAFFSEYQGKYIHFYDDDGVFRNSVQLN